MEIITVLAPGIKSEKLRKMIHEAGKGAAAEILVVRERKDWPRNYKNQKLIFAIELDETGCDLDFLGYLKHLYETRPDFEGAEAAILLNASTELFSKTFAKQIIFNLNQLGLRFIGKPLVEVLPDEINLKTWQKQRSGTRESILYQLCRDLGERLIGFYAQQPKNSRLMVLHNSEVTTSNTLQLANVVIDRLKAKLGASLKVEVVRLEDGTIRDCRGCGFNTCLSFAENKACYFSGDNFDRIFATIEETDAILWVCPNYNDSISASLAATINRMSGLSRTIRLDNKRIYAIVVSANSGGDSVSMQLTDGLCLNKGFMLPPNFALIEIANEPLSVLENVGIHERIDAYVAKMEL